MADDETQEQPTQQTDRPSALQPDEPQWAKELKQALLELPGKITANLTDDDRTSIASQVHGLFEKSGAFTTEETGNETDTTEDTTEQVEHEEAPSKGGRFSRFAQWFEGS